MSKITKDAVTAMHTELIEAMRQLEEQADKCNDSGLLQRALGISLAINIIKKHI